MTGSKVFSISKYAVLGAWTRAQRQPWSER